MNANCDINPQQKESCSNYQGKKIDFDKTVLKIQELVNDSVACEFSSRICSLLYNFLHEIGETGFQLKHLSAISDILEFLARKTRNVQDYEIHLDRVLELYCQPPIFEKNSTCVEVLEKYFTTLGSLLIILPNENQICKVYLSLRRLLFQSKPIFGPKKVIPVEIYHKAAEKSQLPFILVRLLEMVPSVLYVKILDLSLILVSISSLCCRIFLRAGALEHLLIRLHPSYVPGFTAVPPIDNSNLNLDKEDYYEELILATNIAWALVKFSLPLREINTEKEKLPALSKNAMRSLQWAFRREILRSQRSKKSVMMRNDLSSLILSGIAALSLSKFFESGLIDDIALLVAIEVDSKNSWTKDIKLTSSKEDLLFRKVLLLVISHLTESEVAVKIMIDRLVLPAVLELINPEFHNYNRSLSQFWYLAPYAMNTLTFLALKMPREFIKHKGSFRLITMLEWSMTIELELAIFMNLVKTICSIITQNSPMIIEDFCENGIIISVTKLIHRVLNNDTLTMQHQRFLTFLVIIMEGSMNNNKHLQEMYGEESIKLILRLLQRCFHQKKGEFLLDQRILVSIGSFIWRCIVKCSLNVHNFIKRGAIYLLLDIMESANFSARCVYLGLLTDMCQEAFCGSHLCTWRGVDKTKGFMSFLAETWREEERIIGVKRNYKGCIEDLDVPLMGEKQNFSCDEFRDLSPALVDMIGSARCKIYGIMKMMNKEVDKYEKTKEHYKVLIDDIPTEDMITLCIVEKYYHLKKAEVRIELARFLRENGVNSLEIDNEMESIMIQKHRRCAKDIKEKQESILRECQKKELIKEKENYTRIRDSTLAPTLIALREIDFIRKTTETSYTNRQEYLRTQFIEKSLNFPPDADEKNCHQISHYFMNISRQTFSVHDPEMQYQDSCQNDKLPKNSEDQSSNRRQFSESSRV